MKVHQLFVALLALSVATAVVLGDASPDDDEGEGGDVSSKDDRRRDVGNKDDANDEDNKAGNHPGVKCATEACTRMKALKAIIARQHPAALTKTLWGTLWSWVGRYKH